MCAAARSKTTPRTCRQVLPALSSVPQKGAFWCSTCLSCLMIQLTKIPAFKTSVVACLGRLSAYMEVCGGFGVIVAGVPW